ncbi:hypothetical protein M413DRAFT_441595 [Hebeloma cylindrosporum]|uniref:HNH nuclease domain-containing protein n=1 Tax=Hebeloma cylindrosporum TaxID=76867 RepID=A0A0C3CQY7_HEBCY|nr:hypothetical protein M413DRAFT_441595 [Hebeloma cylindrosporum h7]
MTVSSETTHSSDVGFRTDLQNREGYCAWTGIPYGTGLHIIPHRLGSEWLQLIVANRPRYSEDVATLSDINDIRNGVFSNPTIRQGFDQRDIAILKTPNHILCTEDIPPRHHRALMQPDMTYPRQQRYTPQWLVIPDAVTAMHIPNNSDATFKNQSKPKPSDLLLHYNYGVTAVKCWGRGQNVLREQANPPRPSRPVPASKNKSIRDTTVQKLERARLAGGAGAGSSTAGATDGLAESGGRAEWDEDDIVLFLWGNTPAAKERHLKQVGENTRRIEEWREGVPRVSV